MKVDDLIKVRFCQCGCPEGKHALGMMGGPFGIMRRLSANPQRIGACQLCNCSAFKVAP